MRLLLLSFVLTYVSAATTVSKRCGWGPSYWCSTLDNARECMATKHCLGTVWKYQIIKPQATDYCTDCQLVVGELKTLLSDKATENAIAEVAARACAFLPNPDMQNQCSDIIVEYAPELIQMLNNKIKSEVICATLRLCSGLEDRVSPYGVKAHTELAAPNTYCADCTKFFQDVQESITSQETVNELLQLFNQSLCSRLDSLSQLCMNILKDNLPIALHLLAEQLDPAFTCRVFGFCQAKSTLQVPAFKIPLKNIFKPNRKGPLQYRSSEECDICKEVMQQLVNAIQDKIDQEKVINEIETVVCGAAGAWEASCKQLVEQYAPIAFELLVNELDPTTFCEYVSMCPVPTLYGRVKPIVQEKPHTEVMTGYVKQSEFCILCEEFMQELVNVLDSNQTVADIEQFGEKVCDRLSTEYLAKQCRDFVDQYAKELVKVLTGVINPKVLCTELNLCTAKLSKVMKPKLKDEVCDLCVETVKEVKSVLDNMTTEQLVNDLKLVCREIPVTSFQTTCNQYVEKYGPLVIDLLKNEDAHSLCALITLCNETQNIGKMTVPIPEDLSKVDKKGPIKAPPSEMCKICNTIIYVTKMLLESNDTDEEILEEMRAVCTKLSSYASECQALVDAYGQTIINLLKDKLDPSICKTIGLCTDLKKPLLSATSAVLSPLNMLPLPKPDMSKVDVSSSTECTVCNTVAQYIQELLESKTVQADILNKLETFCSTLSSLASECQSLVKLYGPRIIDLLEQELNPDTFCAKLGLCNGLKNPMSAVISPLNTLPLQKAEKSKVPCETCTLAMDVLKDVIGNQITEDAIAAGLESLCNRLPANLQGSCDELVATYELQIIKFMMQELGSGEICKKLGLCDAKKAPIVNMIPLQTAKQVKADDQTSPVTCTICEEAMKIVLKYIGENKTESKIKETLDKVCDTVVPTYSSECKEMVNKYTTMIITFIELDYSGEKICDLLKLCTAVNPNLVPKFTVLTVEDKSDFDLCGLCEKAMDYVLKEIGENKTEEKIKAALETVCGKIAPVPYVAQCKKYVKEYTDVIVKYILKGYGSKKICQEMSICPKPKLQHITLVKDKQGIKLGEGSQCTICKDVVEVVVKLLKENATAAEVEKGLEVLCSKLPSTITKECYSFVKEYTNLVVKLIAKDVKPDQVCKDLKLCTALSIGSWRPATVKILPAGKLDKPVDAKNSAECMVCELVIKALKDIVKQNSTHAEIVQAVKDICKVLPSTISQECEDFVQTYGPVIINLLIQEMNPDLVCDNIKACKATLAASKVQVTGVKCRICEFVLDKLDDMLAENATEEEIIKAVEKVCSILPSSISAECTAFVEKYGTEIIQMLVNDVSPDVVCKTLGLCPQSQMKPTQRKPGKGPDSIECDLCKELCSKIEKYLHQKQTEQDIEKMLIQYCKLLPDTVLAQCKAMVKEYTPQFIQALENNTKPDLVCPALKLCPTARTKPMVEMNHSKENDNTLYFHPNLPKRILGSKKCTWGPGYWCASKENAASCNAVEHCRRHVWKN